MKTLFAFFTIFIPTADFVLAQTPEQKIVGFWYAEELSKSTLYIYQDSVGIIFGKIVESKDSDKIGRTPLYNFKYVSSEKKFIGKVKSATSPLELEGEITFLNDKTLLLVGSKFLLTKRFTLSSIKSPLR